MRRPQDYRINHATFIFNGMIKKYEFVLVAKMKIAQVIALFMKIKVAMCCSLNYITNRIVYAINSTVLYRTLKM